MRRVRFAPSPTGSLHVGNALSAVANRGLGDWMLLRRDGILMLDVRITLKTDDGHLVYMSYRGMRHGPAFVMEQLNRGEPVDPAQVYFRCLPAFETASPALAWINERLFAGSGVRHPDRVAMQFFELA